MSEHSFNSLDLFGLSFIIKYVTSIKTIYFYKFNAAIEQSFENDICIRYFR